MEPDEQVVPDNRKNRRKGARAHRIAVAHHRAKMAAKPPTAPTLDLRKADGEASRLPIVLVQRGRPGKIWNWHATVTGLPDTVRGEGRDHRTALAALERSVRRWLAARAEEARRAEVERTFRRNFAELSQAIIDGPLPRAAPDLEAPPEEP